MLKELAIEFDALFPDHGIALLPCQLRRDPRSFHLRSGERLLMLAVLADAINIFFKRNAERRLLADTCKWIRGSATASISFEDACDALGIDPCALRQRLFQMKYGTSLDSRQRRSSLMLKPPGVSRGPVKMGAAGAQRGRRRAPS
jgi:hypothetical protein